MDSFKSLMDRKEYELVLRLTENTKEPTKLFYRISALLGVGKYEDALKTIEDNQQILQSDLYSLIHIHISMLNILGRFDQAREVAKYYQNLPYESQQVEELLAKLPEIINLEEKKTYQTKHLDEDQLIAKLLSKEVTDVLMAIDSLRDRDIRAYLPTVQKILLNHPKQAIRSFALMLLVDKNVNVQMIFNHLDNQIKVVPSQLKPPFIGENFNNFTRRIAMEFKNPSLSENAIQILSSYIIYVYPDEPVFDDILFQALLEISKKYLKVDDLDDLETRCFNNDLDVNKAKEKLAEIEASIEDF